MSTTKLTREEQETIIRRSAADGHWDVWTDDPVWLRKLSKLRNKEGVEVVEEKEGMIRVLLPRKFIKCSPPRKVSEEQRRAAAERLRKAREAKSP